jgi:alkylation response protein AidB-like acyl-CoA dehydrogenase
MIDLKLTEDQRALQRSVQEVAAREFPIEEGVRAAVAGRQPFDEHRWSRIASLGWFGLGVPEDKGGTGLGLPEAMLMFIELGRVAAAGPLIGTSLAACIAASTSEHQIAAALLSGARRAGIVVGDLVVEAGSGDLGLRITGDRFQLLQLEEVTPRTSFDDAVSVGWVSSAATIMQVTDPDIQYRHSVLVAAYLIGLAEAAVEMSVAYAKLREQFGKPIGTYQAVKHRCSEMLVRAYAARAQLAVGAVLAGSPQPGSGLIEITAGLLLALEAAQRNAEDNVQNHGAIGFTAEHAAGVLVKRAQNYRYLAGPMSELVKLMLTAAESSAA